MSPGSLDLLLRLLEAPSLQFPHSQVVGYHGPAGEELVLSKWLVPNGFVRATEAEDDEDGAVLPVGHDDGHKRFGYYQSAQGWVDVRQSDLQRFRPDLSAIFNHLLGLALTAPPRGTIEVEDGLVWHLGTMRLSRLAPTDVWLARRLGSPAGLQALRAATSKRPPASPRLVLTATQSKHLPTETFARTRIVPVADVLSLHEPTRIDERILQARFNGQVAQAITGPLHLSEDGKVLTINGDTIITFSGEVQLALIRVLVEAHEGNKRMRAADVLEDAGSQARTLQQAFGKQWVELRPYLKSRKGLWGFDL